MHKSSENLKIRASLKSLRWALEKWEMNSISTSSKTFQQFDLQRRIENKYLVWICIRGMHFKQTFWKKKFITFIPWLARTVHKYKMRDLAECRCWTVWFSNIRSAEQFFWKMKNRPLVGKLFFLWIWLGNNLPKNIPKTTLILQTIIQDSFSYGTFHQLYTVFIKFSLIVFLVKLCLPGIDEQPSDTIHSTKNSKVEELLKTLSNSFTTNHFRYSLYVHNTLVT